MREIKYKAWHKTRHVMTKPMTLSFLNHQDIYKLAGNADDYEWLQYINLKDKNDTGVYSGDIVRYGTEDSIVTAIIAFEYGDDGDRFFSGFLPRIFKTEDYPEDGEFGWDDDYSLEIIGNIYENPELLKEK